MSRQREMSTLHHGRAARGLNAAMSALYASMFWRISAPFRAISANAEWLVRPALRMLGRVRRQSAAFLNSTLLSMLPYYHRWVPESWRIIFFARLPARLKRQLVRARSGATIDYQNWILRNDTLSDDDRSLIRAHIASLQNRPKFSILIPICTTPVQYLREAIDSLLGQLYQEWELCVADDPSTSVEVRKTLYEYSQRDDRIRVCHRDVKGEISACINTALEIATGDWIVLMDHNDTLAEHALYLVAEAISCDPNVAIVYSDEDRMDDHGRRSNPHFKPDWDYELFLGQNLICHLGVYRTSLARRVGGFREGLEGAQDWDFALRVLETSPHARVHHIPFVLYHWRCTSSTFSSTSLAGAAGAAQRAVSDHLTRTSQEAEVIPSSALGLLRIRRILPAQPPLVSVIIPTRDRCDFLRKCIDGLVNRTNYKPLEIVIVDNGSSEPDSLAFLADLRTRPGFQILQDNGPFNFSRLVNRGVVASSGEICVLLNNDVDVINADWLNELVSHASRPEVGAVGAKLYYADDTLQHGGVILGLGYVGAHEHKHVQRSSDGYFGRLKLTHSLSCVTGACLAVRRAVYEALGGFDETHLTVAFNDVDFCIRVREAGYGIIWTPYAELYHYESLSRGYETTPEKANRFAAEINYMRTKWGRILENDPFYNPNLSLNPEFFELAATSRVQKPWLLQSIREQPLPDANA
jgi:O-antigen biosynthesis protein